MSSLSFRPPTPIWPKIDWTIIGCAMAITITGIMTMWGAAASDGNLGPFIGYPRGQTLRLIIGSVAMAALVLFDYRKTKAFAWPLYFILIALLVAVLLKGERIKGAQSWFILPLGPVQFSFQPSEFGKIIVVMVLARYLSNRVMRFKKFHHTFVPLLIAGVPIGLIFIQPDLGTAVVFIPVILAMFYVAGIRKRVLIAFALLGVGAAVGFYPLLKPYQKDRIKTFMNPGQDALGKGYNIIQAQAALGSGQMFGKGWGRGTQTSFRFLPEYQTDFVFPTFGEQFGLAGCLVILALYGIMLLRATYLAGATEDLYGALLVTGLVTVFVVHIVLNIGMATGLMPVTGLPLPLFSYGGSFILVCYMMIGLIVSVGARRDG
jgi:rod shape determining protein RodA